MIQFRSVLVGLALMLSMLPLSVAYSQGGTQPTAIIDAAYADVSRRVGKPIARGGDSNFRWEETSFPDASLGCPQPGQTYAQAVTKGFRIVITYQNIAYDYRATLDGKTLFLCSPSGGAPSGSAPVVATNPPITNPTNPPVVAPPVNAGTLPQPATAAISPAEAAATVSSTLALMPYGGNVAITQPRQFQPVQITGDSTVQFAQGSPLYYNTKAYSNFRWAPDGTRLLFTELTSRNVYVAVSGQAPIRVASGASTNFPAAWSPDGSKIAYVVSTNQQVGENGLQQQVQSVTLTGTTLSAPQFAGSFVFGVACGGGGDDPAEALYNTEAGYGGNRLILEWTTRGFIHSINCTGEGIALTQPDGKDIWNVGGVGRISLSPDRSRAAGVIFDQGRTSSSVATIDLSTGALTKLNIPELQAPALADQTGWSADSKMLYFSTLRLNQRVQGVASAPAGRQIFQDRWPYEGPSYTVAMWRIALGQSNATKGFESEGRAIASIVQLPDGSGVLFTLITSTGALIQSINSGASAQAAVGALPTVQLWIIRQDGKAGLIGQAGQPAPTAAAFAPSAAAQAAPAPATQPPAAPPAAVGAPNLVVGGKAIVTTSGTTLNVRQSPTRGASVTRLLNPGSVVDIISGPQSNDGFRWWQIRTDNGVTGWVVDQITDSTGTTNTLTPQ